MVVCWSAEQSRSSCRAARPTQLRTVREEAASEAYQRYDLSLAWTGQASVACDLLLLFERHMGDLNSFRGLIAGWQRSLRTANGTTDDSRNRGSGERARLVAEVTNALKCNHKSSGSMGAHSDDSCGVVERQASVAQLSLALVCH